MEYEHLTTKISGFAETDPDKIAIVHGNRHITYLELEKQSNRIANYFYTRYRREKILELNPKVMIILDRSAELIAVLIALLKSGMIFVPLDSELPENRIHVLMEETQPDWLVTCNAYYDKFREVFAKKEGDVQFVLLDVEKGRMTGDDKGDSRDKLLFERVTNKYAYIYFTSGSTGTPKGVLGRHKSLSHFIDWEIREFGIDSNVHVSQLTSPSFDAILRDIFVPLTIGGVCCIPETHTLMSPSRLLKWFDREQINLVHTVPSFFKTLVPEIEDAHCLLTMRYILLSGELLRGRDVKRFAAIFKNRIQLVNFYGPTETTMIKLFYRIKAEDVNKPIIPVGKAMAGAQVMVLDKEMQKCLIGNVGEIYIRTPYTSAGYFNDKETNKKVFLKNPFSRNPHDLVYKTGDLGRWLIDGNIEVIGRTDDQVKIRGVRVELGEIENELLKHESIKEAVVIDRQAENGDTFLCAYLVAECTAQSADPVGQPEAATNPTPPLRGTPPVEGNPEHFIVSSLKVLSARSPLERGSAHKIRGAIRVNATKGSVPPLTGPPQAGRGVLESSQKNKIFTHSNEGENLVFARNNDRTDLREYLSRILPDYMIPTYFVELDRMPLKPNGKIDKQALPDPRRDMETRRVSRPPRDNIDTKLVSIWSDILSIKEEHISIEDDFFHLGGHSLRGMNMISRIKKEFGIDISLRIIFKELTIKGISQYLKKNQASIFDSIIPVEKRDYYEISSAQKRLFFIHMMEGDRSTSYNMHRIVQIEGKIDQTHLQKTFAELIKRHESLRTSFHIKAEKPVQRIHNFNEVEFAIEFFDTAVDRRTAESISNSPNPHHSKPIVHDLIHRFSRPFDLSLAPLLRVCLIKTGEPRHILMVEMHHIISDGTSVAILIEEFMHIYAGEEITPLKLQYKDFSSWQNHLFESGEMKEQEDYWLNLLANAEGVPRLNLPTDFERPEIYSFAGDSYGFVLDREVANGLKDMDLECGVTLYMNLLAALNVLFYKYTGQEDIIIGSGDAGRFHPDLQAIIGMFVNTRGMRNFPRGDKSYHQFLQEVKENCLKAFENKDARFEILVEKLKLERESSRSNPLFDVFLAVQNYEMPTIEDKYLKEVSFRNYRSEHLISKFDMTLYVMEIGDNIYFSIEYATALFKRSTIEEIGRHFVEILAQAVQNRNKKLKDFAVSHDFEMVKPHAVKDYQEDFGFD